MRALAQAVSGACQGKVELACSCYEQKCQVAISCRQSFGWVTSLRYPQMPWLMYFHALLAEP